MLYFGDMLVVIAAAWVVYGGLLAIYRLYFHPLAGFPGPKLMAITQWPETYWDVFRRGKFVFRIKEMHEKYGPIVRTTPDEIHVNDPYFYESIYASSAKTVDKFYQWAKFTPTPGSIWATVDHDHHRLRRSALNPFFAKRSILRLEHVIQEKVQKVIDYLDTASSTGAVVRLDTLFMAVTVDVITQYAFAKSYNHLDQPDPGLEWKKVIVGGFEGFTLIRHFPWLLASLKRIPDWLLAYFPQMAYQAHWERGVREDVAAILAEGRQQDPEKAAGTSTTSSEMESPLGPTIFHHLRDSDLPPAERTLDRLCDEGFIVTGAGSETTAKTLYTIAFYVTDNPTISQRLKQDISLLPADAKLPQIEQLPYLTAVIKEGLRLSYGATSRLPRVHREPLKYGNWVIPAGTPVSETIPFTSTNAEIFPEPMVYRPERWIEADAEGKKLDRFLLSFCRGTRGCIGINLAWAELYLVLFHLFQSFTLELFETTVEDVGFEHDFFVAIPMLDSKGVRAKVRKVV